MDPSGQAATHTRLPARSARISNPQGRRRRRRCGLLRQPPPPRAPQRCRDRRTRRRASRAGLACPRRAPAPKPSSCGRAGRWRCRRPAVRTRGKRARSRHRRRRAVRRSRPGPPAHQCGRRRPRAFAQSPRLPAQARCVSSSRNTPRLSRTLRRSSPIVNRLPTPRGRGRARPPRQAAPLRRATGRETQQLHLRATPPSPQRLPRRGTSASPARSCLPPYRSSAGRSIQGRGVAVYGGFVCASGETAGWKREALQRPREIRAGSGSAKAGMSHGVVKDRR
jgi:hypothetical protein